MLYKALFNKIISVDYCLLLAYTVGYGIVALMYPKYWYLKLKGEV